jgi:putative membrane protein insertion efficiency factor
LTKNQARFLSLRTMLCSVAQKILLFFLRIYQIAVSPFLGSCCRFYPSCSDYAAQAIICHGAMRGTFVAIKRLCRCHPFCSGGIDPIPVAKSKPSSLFKP